MKKTTTPILLILAAAFLAACGENPKGIVKGGVLQFNTSVTVGKALDRYAYFKSTSWDTVETPEGETFVQFQGIMDLKAYAGSSLEGTRLTGDMIKKARNKMNKLEIAYQVQFSVSEADRTFDVRYSGINITGLKRIDNGEDTSIDQSDDDLSSLEAIYRNKPEMKTWGFLIVLGQN